MRYFSTFAGIGGFEQGIKQAYEKAEDRRLDGDGEQDVRLERERREERDVSGDRRPLPERPDGHPDGVSGPTCVGYSEIDKYATKIYERHFSDHKNYGDITKIDADALPDFDLLVGGFPCQAFSIAGKRKGFEDTRGTLFFEIARILRAKQPRLFLLENVKGLLSHDGGKTFSTIISTLDELGYDLQWQVLNSKNHGVPQNRERVFIVGHLRGTPRPQVFPFGASDGLSVEGCGQGEAQGGVSSAITTNYRKGVHSGGETYAIQQRPRGKNVGGEHELVPTLTGRSFQDNNHVISRTVRSGGRSSPHGSKQNWDSYELNGSIRRLTPTECERLQGFPDGWTDGVSDTQRYKCLGNAVTVNVIEAIVSKLI